MAIQTDGNSWEEARIADGDGFLVEVGEIWIADNDGIVVPVWTSIEPLAPLGSVDIGTAGTHTITAPEGAGFAFALIVGGGGGGSMYTAGTAGQWVSGVIPAVTSTATIGAGGSGGMQGGRAGSPTSLGGLVANGGAGATQFPGGTTVSTRTVTLPPDEVLITGGENNFTIGPGGVSGQSGQRGGGSGSVGFMGSVRGGDGWVRVWFWNRDPREELL